MANEISTCSLLHGSTDDDTMKNCRIYGDWRKNSGMVCLNSLSLFVCVFNLCKLVLEIYQWDTKCWRNELNQNGTHMKLESS